MEAIALMADIHANLPAAEAVIADIRRKHKPDRIVSLGDQVNLGPAPCDTLRRNHRRKDIFLDMVVLRRNHL